MAITWNFVQAGIGEWRWQKLDREGKVIDESIPGFISKVECFNDAKSNGYPDQAVPARFESLQIKSDKKSFLR
jgi:hypothetical protein